ncbi:MAG: peptide ABC transporter substrate-binding protein [Phycisphaeraceae bacterium]
MKSLPAIILLMGAALLALPGCGDDLPDAAFTFITTTEHHDLDPQKMSWVHDIRLARTLYRPLVELDYATMEIAPAVAAGWEITEDQTVYTFHLREEARWSNGDRVTAGDFVYAWRRAMLPDMAASYTHLMFHIKGASDFFDWRSEQLEQFDELRQQQGEDAARRLWAQTERKFDELVGLDAPDERTLVVTLERPTPYFLSLVSFSTFMPVHRASVAEATALNTDTGMQRVDGGYWSDPQRLVTNGAYWLARYVPQRYALLEKNPHVWDAEAIQTEKILERIIRNPQSARRTYSNGGADFWPGVPGASTMAADLVSAERSDVHVAPLAGTYFYNFNCMDKLRDGRDNPLADARVRRALALAIDRETIVQRVTRLNQPIARSFVPTDALPDYEPPVEEGVTFDPERARELLAEAGHADGEGLEGLSILYNTGHGHEKVAQAIQSMWNQHLNVSITLEPSSSTAFGERLDNHDYTIARASWIGDYPDATTWLDKMTSDSTNNDCGWFNTEYDTLLEQARDETDTQRRIELLREAEAVLLREQPMALIFQYVHVNLWDPARVRGLEANNWARWRLEDVVMSE